MTAGDAPVDRAARLLDARIGLKPDPSFRSRLARALKDVADAAHTDRETLVGALAADASLLDQLLERVTVQETAFFRHPEHFDTIRAELLPTIRPPFRAWSAACSNGQEAYSLAMLMSETGGSGSVFASDISPAALLRTASATYHDREMRGVSVERRRRHFVATADDWQARQGLRAMVTVQRHNLLDPIPARVAACHVVMCRNVLIYFTRHHAEMFLERLADAMSPDAHLFVGAAETLWQLTDRFEPIQLGASYVYRPRPRESTRRTIVVNRGLAAIVAAPPPDAQLAVARPSAAVTRDVEDASTSYEEHATDSHDGNDARALLASGSVEQAIVAFRRWTYMSPDDPTAHFQLGSALDSSGARPPALRAYRAALAALDRGDADRLVDVLHGYDRAALRRLLVDRCTETSAPVDAVSSTTLPGQREGPVVTT